eukprot:CAMPEP_0201539758 /NCGR_PEP_ID=MMETSP0161_2-20130828/70576_1 /ASSEMBLY_ACC=CAM_ASM_000251 /TAXON_ID=180227 /ORGANISM="Neoparamoeba aestuarina, Strain SoJaBio B1-5/56/2" /LENGTH=189 /DNA_ID=CAMNT_0047947175 /DNA_START=660 /DNA_END=1229 /DNA_ORIENTATION=+
MELPSSQLESQPTNEEESQGSHLRACAPPFISQVEREEKEGGEEEERSSPSLSFSSSTETSPSPSPSSSSSSSSSSPKISEQQGQQFKSQLRKDKQEEEEKGYEGDEDEGEGIEERERETKRDEIEKEVVSQTIPFETEVSYHFGNNYHALPHNLFRLLQPAQTLAQSTNHQNFFSLQNMSRKTKKDNT